MIKQISIQDLRVGMYIHDLNCDWIAHPFFRNKFLVKDTETLQKVTDWGIKKLKIDTTRGADAVLHSPPTPIEPEESQAIRVQPDWASKGTPSPTPLAEEEGRATRLHRAANQIVRNIMTDVRLGRQIELERIEPMVESMVDSIFRNQDAILPLSRLRNHDAYTFEHSVNVCTLMLIFARSLGLSKEELREVGLGALLHDVGKAKVPDEILNKPGKLTEAEFRHMKNHVTKGLVILQNTPGISDIVLRIAGEHHERYDGTGYPKKLKGDQISLYGRMAAIVDIYDAISSNRIYHVGIPPTLALKKLLDISGSHLDPLLVQVFIKSLGIYPTGSLVQLKSGRLGIVIEQNEEQLLSPIVRVFFNTKKQSHIPEEVVDLSRSEDRIASHEDFDTWGLNIRQYMVA